VKNVNLKVGLSWHCRYVNG